MTTGIDEKLIQEIVRRIVAVAAPDRIILYGSAATGQMTPDSDIDLLVLEAAEPQSTWKERERIREALRGLGYRFDVLVMGTERFEETKDFIGGMAFAPNRYGKVVYTKPGAAAAGEPEGASAPGKPPEQVIRELRDQWIAIAERNLAMARHALSEGFSLHEMVAVRARYAAEQYLKAFLTHHQIEFTKINDLIKLTDLVATAAPDLAASVQEATALNPYDLDWMPTDECPEPTPEEAEAAVSLAAKARAAVRAALALD